MGVLVFTILVTLFYWGGSGVGIGFGGLVGGIVGLAFLVRLSLITKKLRYPTTFLWFGLALLTFVITTVSSINRYNSLEYLYLFVSGGIWWVVAANAPLPQARQWLRWGLIMLTVLFSATYGLVEGMGVSLPIGPTSLAAQAGALRNHSHLGDWWALMLVLVLADLFFKRARHFILPIGLAFLLLAWSRAAYVSLAAGMYPLWKTRSWNWILGVLVVFLVVVTSIKPLVLTRGYWWQAVAGFLDRPWGYGMGNFSEIALAPQYQVLHLTYSRVVHNFPLELLVGVGICAVVWYGWFFTVGKQVWKRRNSFYSAGLFSLAVNFSFDATYVVPTLVWLGFILLGLGERDARN